MDYLITDGSTEVRNVTYTLWNLWKPLLMHCVVPENTYTSPTELEGMLSKTPCPPLWKFQVSFIHFFKCFDLTDAAPLPRNTPQEIPNLSVEVVWIFLELHIITLPNYTSKHYVMTIICFFTAHIYVTCRLGGPYSENLWPRSWKCCPRPQTKGSIFKPEVTVSLYGPTLSRQITYLFFSCAKLAKTNFSQSLRITRNLTFLP